MNGSDICFSASSCFVVCVLSVSVICHFGCVPAVFMSECIVDVFVNNAVSSEDVVIILWCAMHSDRVTRCLLPFVLR